MLREVEALRNGWTRASARAKAVKLTGWERLYVVVCVLFAAVTWHYGALHFPTKASDDSYWTSQAQFQYPDVARYEEDQFCVKVGAQPANGSPPCGYVPEPPLPRQLAYAGILQDGKKYAEHGLGSRQANVLGEYSFYWLAACILLYWSGLVIAWVRRGFQQQRG